MLLKFHISIEGAALKIELQVVPVRLFSLGCVFHYNHVDGLEPIGPNGEQPKDLGNQWSVIVDNQVVDEVVKHVQEDLLFVSLQGLDDEALIRGEEKEGATLTSALAGFEDLRSVGLEVERIFNGVRAQSSNAHYLSELFGGVGLNLCFDL